MSIDKIEADILDTVPSARSFAEGKSPQATINPKIEVPQIKHDWLYSVVPLFPSASGTLPTNGGIYLVGYCRRCRSAFTVRLRETDSITRVVMVERLEIPVYGCQPVDGA